MSEDIINFELPSERKAIIKVIGVGGGGSNAVNHMYRQGIKDVNFVVCNTDAQALQNSPVPIKLQLGESLTEGRGAGSKPEIGKQSAIENLQDVIDVLEENTKMVFITAGMGGGTGTGAAPIIAKAAKERGILTVAIVTIPFSFEGKQRQTQAIEGINEIRNHVDSLLVINNEKLREIYGNLRLADAFTRADNVLASAAKGIAEIITVHGYINVDFADVQTVMTESGVAMLGSAEAEGENRAIEAIKEALTSPLLNNSDIRGAKSILLNITSGLDEISVDELGVITDYVQSAVASDTQIIWGVGHDEKLENKISVTIIATGFSDATIPELYKNRPTDRVHLEDPKRRPTDFDPKEFDLPSARTVVTEQTQLDFTQSSKSVYELRIEDELTNKDRFDKANDNRYSEVEPRRVKPMGGTSTLQNPSSIDDLENVPAYVRRRQKMNPSTSEAPEQKVSRFTLSEDKSGNPVIRQNNSFLHDNVD